MHPLIQCWRPLELINVFDRRVPLYHDAREVMPSSDDKSVLVVYKDKVTCLTAIEQALFTYDDYI